jgi:hypothetical protein
MAKQTINIGASANDGSGDPLRVAFDKINDNFDELYATEHDLSSISQSIIPDTDVAYDLGSATNRFRDLYLSGSTIDLGGTTLSISGGALQVGGAPVVSQSDLTGYVTQAQLAAGSITVNATGDMQGSVFADDSTLLVDAVNGSIPYSVLSGTPTIPTALSDLTNDLDYASIVGGAIQNNGLPVLPTQTLDISGSVFGDDSTLLVDGVNSTIVGDVENGRVITGIVRSATDADLYVYAGGTGSVILAGQSDLTIGHTSGQVDIYGGVEFNNGTTAFQSGNSVDFNCDVDFNDVVKFAKTTTTGADDNPTLTLIDVNSSGVQVLTSNDNNTNNWELPDGSEGQIMHFVAGGAGGSGANHKIKINNWWKRDGDTGGWSSVSGYWDVFAIYGFAGRADTGMATAIFVDGAWRTTSPWVD